MGIEAISALLPSIRQDFLQGNLKDLCRNEIDAAVVAAVISLKSPCQSKRGAVIWDQERQYRVNVGWNDQPFGFRCDGSDDCKRCCGQTAIHAEESAILATDYYDLRRTSMIHIKTVGGEPVPSGRPSCIRCSGMILESGIAWMWLLHEDGLKRYSAEEFHAETIRTLGLYAVQRYTKIDGIIKHVEAGGK